MGLPDKYRGGWIKFSVSEAELGAFAKVSKGRLYLHFPNLQPAAMSACVWRLDPNGVVFRLDGPAVGVPPLASIPPERQVHLSPSWIWAADATPGETP